MNWMISGARRTDNLLMDAVSNIASKPLHVLHIRPNLPDN
jgi:hypothetical protein